MALFGPLARIGRENRREQRQITKEEHQAIKQKLKSLPAEHRLALAQALEDAHAEEGGGSLATSRGESSPLHNAASQQANMTGAPMSMGMGAAQYTEFGVLALTSVATTVSLSTTTAAPPGLFWCQRLVVTQELAAGGPGSGASITVFTIGGVPILQGAAIGADGYGPQSRYIRELNRWIYTSQPTSLTLVNNSTGTLLLSAYYQGWLWTPQGPPQGIPGLNY